MIQYFEPRRTAFQAEVALGSLWKVEPLRAGPRISQRWAGRSGPRCMKRSGPKQGGGVYAGVGDEAVEQQSVEVESPMVRFIFSAKKRSKR